MGALSVNRIDTLTGRRPVLPTLTAAIVAVLLAACTQTPAIPTPLGAETSGEVPSAQYMPGETGTSSIAVPGDGPHFPGQGILGLSQSAEQITWQTDDGERKSLSIQEVEGAYPKIFDPGLSQIGRPAVSPSGRFFAYVAGPVVGSLLLHGWHLGLADENGALVGLYSAQTHPRCYVHDFVWLPDEKGIVVEPAACGAIGHLVLLTEDAKVVFEVTTRGIKGILYVSPDSRWAALDDGPFAGPSRRIEFISLENPDMRLDLSASEIGGLHQWLEREWVRPQT